MVTIDQNKYAVGDWFKVDIEDEGSTEGEACMKNKGLSNLHRSPSTTGSYVYACKYSAELETALSSVDSSVAKAELLASFKGTKHFNK